MYPQVICHSLCSANRRLGHIAGQLGLLRHGNAHQFTAGEMQFTPRPDNCRQIAGEIDARIGAQTAAARVKRGYVVGLITQHRNAQCFEVLKGEGKVE